MNKILLLTGLITLLTSTGCIVAEGERHGGYRSHERYHQSVVIVGPPVVVVRPPEIIVR